jgi:hemimethylated DNA binding protein
LVNQFLISENLIIVCSLLRIRNTHAAAHFKRFDSKTNYFVPNEVIAYEFPNDLLDEFRQPPLLNEKSEQAAKDVIEGVQQMADHLRNVILGFTSAPESRGLKLLAFFLEKLNALSDGDVVPVKDRFSADLPTTQKLASMHLQKLLNLVVEIGELLWQKRMSAECERPIKFALGDVVRHKEYDFRGVVVAWDPEPSIDVSRWDGLQHIKDPHQFPFYHIIPDQNDCIQAFGGERHSKYVCEENLEICHRDSRDIDVDLAPEWDFDSADGVYIPPDDLKVSEERFPVKFWIFFIAYIFVFDSSLNIASGSKMTLSQNVV